jgi:hypothetical protein
MSATTTGVGATSGDAGALATGAAAAGGERNRARAAVHGNENNLNSQARARAQDGGTFADSRTRCRNSVGDSVECTTRTMTHEPGQKPERSTVTGSATIPR